MSPLIEIKRLCVSYGTRPVLQDFDLTLFDHDYLGIIGPNGSGKTTLLKCVLGLIKPASGSIAYHSCRRPGQQPTLGYLPQRSLIDPKFPITVEEVVLSGLASGRNLTARFSGTQRERARQTIARMNLEGLEHRPIGALSGGQLQRVLLGRAIIADPEILILDEPSTYIDKGFEAHLYHLLEELNRDCAIMIVSHDLHTIRQEAKRIVTLGD